MKLILFILTLSTLCLAVDNGWKSGGDFEITGDLTVGGTITGGGSGLSIGGAITGGVINRILFEDSSNLLGESANFTWTDGTQLLKIGGLRFSGSSNILRDTAAGVDLVRFNTTNQFMTHILADVAGIYLGKDGAAGSVYNFAEIHGTKIGAGLAWATPSTAINYEAQIFGVAGNSTIQLTNTASGNLSTDGVLLDFGGTNFEINNQEGGYIGLENDLRMKQVATPATPAATYNKLYFKSDNILYQKTSAGVESAVGGASFPLLAPAGTAAAPSYSFSAESNMGMYRVGSGQLGFAALGSTVMNLRSSNYAEFSVGIIDTDGTHSLGAENTTNAYPFFRTYLGTGGVTIGVPWNTARAPYNANYELDIRGGAGDSVAQFTNTTTGSTASDGFVIGIESGGDGVIYHNEAKPIKFYTSGIERGRFTSTDGYFQVGGSITGAPAFPVITGKAASGATEGVRLLIENTQSAHVYGFIVGGSSWNDNFGIIDETAGLPRMKIDGTTGKMEIGKNLQIDSTVPYSLVIRGQADDSTIQLSNNTTGNTSTDGTKVGIDSSGNFEINNQEGLPIKITGGELQVTTVGKGLSIKEGSNSRQNTCTLVAGTCTISNTSVAATDRIYCTGQVAGGVPGGLNVSSRTAATSYVVTSTNVADTSDIACILVGAL